MKVANSITKNHNQGINLRETICFPNIQRGVGGIILEIMYFLNLALINPKAVSWIHHKTVIDYIPHFKCCLVKKNFNIVSLQEKKFKKQKYYR